MCLSIYKTIILSHRMAEDIDLTQLKPYTMIEGPMWSGPATFIQMVSNTMIIIQLDGETKMIPIVPTGHGIQPASTAQGESWKAFVAVERLRHEYAKNLGMPGSAHQLPHQLKTIYQVSGEPGRIRYMIADEPGGGKTVVASRIIQELFIQKQVQRVLVVVPALLKYQWQDELKRFVNMESRVIEGEIRGQTNLWLSDDKPILITSMDYAKQDAQMSILGQARFDMVVVDEAHNLNATLKNKTTRYKLGELLGSISKHMLFLTATPHRGKSDNFRLLLKLLEPDLFSNPKMTEADVSDAKDRLFIRHAKNDMLDMNGDQLFLGRNVKSVKYTMSKTERELYDKVTGYVQRQYTLQIGRSTNRIATFAVLIIQKRMASSTQALLESLRRRRQKLEDHLKDWNGPADNYTIQDLDDMDDAEREDAEDKAAEYTSAQTPEELETELEELDKLIILAERTSKTKPDTKLDKLISEIKGIGDDKLLIFSEYRDTLDYLQKKISEMQRGDGLEYDICRIDGTMDMSDREDAQKKFRTHSQIMLATDAAREGINLQFCHRMINYDLPWTPISLEQRMGRLHRYGQEHEVVISNMVAADTREGNVMETLFKKIRQIERQYPTFNVLGQILAGGDLDGLMTDAIRGSTADDIGEKVTEAAERAKKVDGMLGRTPIDVQRIRDMIQSIKAQRTDGKYLVQMMERLFEGLGGRIRYASGKTRLDVPDKIKYGPLATRRSAYDVAPDELLARGGRIYDHLNEWIRRHCSNDLKFGSVFCDPGGFDGYLVFHTIPIQDKGGRPISKLLAVHKYANGMVTSVEPSILHDMKYDDVTDVGTAPQMDQIQTAVVDMGRAEASRITVEQRKLWEYRTEAAKKRIQTEVEDLRREIGTTGFGAKRNELVARLQELKRRKEEIDTEYDMAVTLTPHAPILEGWVRVIPDSDGPHGTNTERIGMEVSMKHERSEGFEVQNVSGTHNIGYDVLSKHSDGRRREIEVKARCDAGDIDFTEAEYKHMKSSKHAVIHVVSNAGQPNQRLDVISDTSNIQTTHRHVYRASRTEVRRLAD